MGEVSTQKASFDKEALQKDADDYFLANPQAEPLTATSDGVLFINKKFAVDHSHSLADKTLTKFANANAIEVEQEEEVSGDAYQLTDADKELLQSGLESKNYNAIKALAKNLKIETTDQKAETLIKALEEYKNQ